MWQGCPSQLSLEHFETLRQPNHRLSRRRSRGCQLSQEFAARCDEYRTFSQSDDAVGHGRQIQQAAESEYITTFERLNDDRARAARRNGQLHSTRHNTTDASVWQVTVQNRLVGSKVMSTDANDLLARGSHPCWSMLRPACTGQSFGPYLKQTCQAALSNFSGVQTG
jgi:hypothetical protein